MDEFFFFFPSFSVCYSNSMSSDTVYFFHRALFMVCLDTSHSMFWHWKFLNIFETDFFIIHWHIPFSVFHFFTFQLKKRSYCLQPSFILLGLARMGDGGYSYILYISLMCLQVLQPPAGYVPIRTPARKLIATPTPMVGAAGTPTGFRMQTPDSKTAMVDMQPKGNLPMMKPDDMQYFDKLLVSAHCLLLVNDCWSCWE